MVEDLRSGVGVTRQESNGLIGILGFLPDVLPREAHAREAIGKAGEQRHREGYPPALQQTAPVSLRIQHP
jgi:hypothetical protein